MRFFFTLFLIVLYGPALAQSELLGRFEPQRMLDDLGIATSARPPAKEARSGILFRINPELQALAKGKPLPDKAQRIGIVRHNRVTSFFVERELILVSEQADLIEKTTKALGATPGKRLAFNPVRTRRAPPVLMQRIRLDKYRKADTSIFRTLEKESDGRFDGVYEVSSAEALATLEAALTTHLDSAVSVGINWIFEPVTLENEILLEGFNGAGTGFVNAFDLPYLNGDGVAQIGVTHAWHLLKAAGVLDEDNFAVPPSRVTVGVVDQGFHSAVDVRNPEFNGAPVNTAGSFGCSGGGACPWHGSNVAEAMTARLGNVRAVAGPAGPVADRVILQSIDGFQTWSLLGWIAGVAESATGGPRVANMSFSNDVDYLWIWSTAALDIGIATLEAAGTLVVASAGNDGADIDQFFCPETQLSDCSETTRRIPCELKGVVCVGAIGNNDVQISGFSAVGALPGSPGQDGDTVDIFAPGQSILVGADPSSTTGPVIDGPAQGASGTSFSAPVTAGVAALIAAADPSLSVADLRSRLLANASTNETDLPVGQLPDPLLIRWLNAERPVRFTLRQRFPNSDFAPRAEIVVPRAGIGKPVLDMLTDIPFTVRAVDVEDGIGCCTPQWSVDGVLRSDLVGTTVSINFDEERDYVIGVSVTDSGGQSDSDELTIRARQ